MTGSGVVEIKVPSYRNSEFEPKVINKRQTVLEDLQDKIMALYSKGMTIREIQEIVEDMYRVEVILSLLSRLTDMIVHGLK